MIEKKKIACGGKAIFSGTRIPVWSIVKYLRIGVGDREILETFPSLKAYNIDEAREYFKKNKAEMERDISENT